MTSYSLGQVIYAVLRKEAKVFPLQVVEISVKKTLDGEMTSYVVRAGQDPKKVAALDGLDAEVFDNAEAAKVALIDRATQSIVQRVSDAVSRAREWYPSGHELRSSVDLGSLVKETVRAGAQKTVGSLVRPEVAMLAAELAAGSQDSAETFVELPGGVKAKVKSVKLPAELQG